MIPLGEKSTSCSPILIGLAARAARRRGKILLEYSRETGEKENIENRRRASAVCVEAKSTLAVVL